MPSEFWGITPYELSVLSKANAEVQKTEHELRCWLAWNIAALGRAKKLPSMKSFIGVKEDPKTVGRKLKAIMKASFPSAKKD